MHRLRNALCTDTALWALVIGAFVLRVVGIGYGLPLTLVADEPPFVLAALQMIQLHTLIPALHEDAFRSVLYYPPYISYLYLTPYVGVLGVEYILWHGSGIPFVSHALANLAPFFIIARLLSAAIGAASVFLIYRIAQSFFHSRAAAAGAGFLLATSLLHQSLSMVGRHWIYVSFFFLLSVYILMREHLPEARRLFYACLTIALGIGVSTITAFALVFVALWWSLHSTLSVRDLLREKWAWASAAVLLFFGPLPLVLYPNSTNHLMGALAPSGKSLGGALMSPAATLAQLVYAEPVLVGSFLVGLLLLFLARRWQHFLFVSIFFLLYTLLFYFLTQTESRFLLPLIPFMALVGGYAIDACLRHRLLRIGILMLLCIPLAASLRLSWLAWHGDTRAQARTWALSTLQPEDTILVYAELTRLPSDARSVAELRAIDPSAVRKTDEAEAAVGTAGPHALSLYAVQHDAFFATLPQYAREHHYRYVLVEPGFGSTTAQAAFIALTAHAKEVAAWQGLGSNDSIAGSTFTLPLSALFSGASLGPTVVLYQLP